MTASTDQRTSGMLRQRHTQSDTHRAVKAAVERSRASGIIQSAAGIARDAHTTESFLYRHEGRPCQLCREVFDGGPISYYRAQMASITQARDRDADREGRVTAATIQADLANAKAANQRKRQQIRALERRLGEVLGTSAQNSIAELQRSADDGEPSPQRLAQMAEQIATLKATLSERGQELDAARRLNADLTRQLNQRTGASPISANLQVDVSAASDDGEKGDRTRRSSIEPESSAARIAEIQDLLDDLDSTPLDGMTQLHYQHGYWELELAVRDLLRIIDNGRLRGDP